MKHCCFIKDQNLYNNMQRMYIRTSIRNCRQVLGQRLQEYKPGVKFDIYIAVPIINASENKDNQSTA